MNDTVYVLLIILANLVFGFAIIYSYLKFLKKIDIKTRIKILVIPMILIGIANVIFIIDLYYKSDAANHI